MMNKKQLLENLCLLAFVFSSVNFIFYVSIGYDSAIRICLYGMGSSSITYWAVRLRNTKELGAHFYCFTTVIFFFFFIFTSGGISSPILPWLMMIPVVSFQLHNRKYAIFWTTVSFFILLFFAYCWYATIPLNNELQDKYKMVVTIISTSGLLLFSLFSTIIYRNANTKMLHEIAQLAKVEEQQRASIHFWIKGQEAERKRIAMELHDSVAQMIVSTRFKLSFYKNTNLDIHKLNEVDHLLEATLAEIKTITNELHPKTIELSGLHRAIETLLEDIKNTHGLEVQYTMDQPLEEFNSFTSIHIFRILQECMKNIVVHSKATKIEVYLFIKEDSIDLTVNDNGIGFDVAAVSVHTSNGLFHIQERVNYLKGKLTLESKKNKGTSLLIQIPYER